MCSPPAAKHSVPQGEELMASERAPDMEGVFNLLGHLRVRLSTTRANPR